jgi:hypothetical protein
MTGEKARDAVDGEGKTGDPPARRDPASQQVEDDDARS